MKIIPIFLLLLFQEAYALNLEKLDMAKLNEYEISFEKKYDEVGGCYHFKFSASRSTVFEGLGVYNPRQASLLTVRKDSDNPYLLLGQGQRKNLLFLGEKTHFNGTTPCTRIDNTYVTILYVKEDGPPTQLFIPLSLFGDN